MKKVVARRRYDSRRGYVNGLGGAAHPMALLDETLDDATLDDATLRGVVAPLSTDETETAVVSTEEVAETPIETPAESLEQSSVEQAAIVDYASWRVVDLVAELKKRGLQSSGTKGELVARLQEHDLVK